MDDIYLVTIDASLRPELKRHGISPNIMNIHFVKAPTANSAKRVILSFYRQDMAPVIAQCMQATRLTKVLASISDRNILWTYVRKAGDPKFAGQQGVEVQDTPAQSAVNDLSRPAPTRERQIETVNELRPEETHAPVVENMEPLLESNPGSSTTIVEKEPEVPMEMDDKGNLKITPASLQDIIAKAIAQATNAQPAKSGKASIQDLEDKARVVQKTVQGPDGSAELIVDAATDIGHIVGLTRADAESMERIRHNLAVAKSQSKFEDEHGR